MKLSKILVSFLAFCAAFSLTLGSAFASSLSVAVDLTKVKVSNFNFGSVDNVLSTYGNTGWNWRVGGTSDTGNAAAGTAVSTGLNSSATGVGVYEAGIGPVAANVDGYFGLAAAIDLTNVKVSNFNLGFVGNYVGTYANSGWNLTFGGSSDTGDATANASVSNAVNSSRTSVAVYDFEAGPIVANYAVHTDSVVPAGFGPWFNPIAGALDVTNVGVCNFNFGTVANLVTTGANTGYNATYGGISDTGNAYAASSVVTGLNSNDTTVVVVDGGIGPVAVNAEPMRSAFDLLGGGPSMSLALAAELTSVKVGNMNDGMVLNVIDTRANTGHNLTLRGGSSDTGNAVASSSIGNTVNTNSTMVGVADSGVGPIAANVEVGATNATGVVSVGPVAVNAGMGGVAATLDATTVNVNNTNTGTVANVTTTTANTGNNMTVGGVGAGTVQTTVDPLPSPTASSNTGDASASTSVTNNVNSNTTTVVVGAPLN